MYYYKNSHRLINNNYHNVCCRDVRLSDFFLIFRTFSFLTSEFVSVLSHLMRFVIVFLLLLEFSPCGGCEKSVFPFSLQFVEQLSRYSGAKFLKASEGHVTQLSACL